MSKPVCVVIGVGPGNGSAFARRFASGGHRVALVARSEDYLEELAAKIDGARPFVWDVNRTDEAAGLFERIGQELGSPKVVIYNAGSGVFGDFDAVTEEDLESAWRVNVAGLLAVAKQAVPIFRDEGAGRLVVIGATASLRGGANFAAFASAKAAQRSLAQSLARRLGPEGIHVSYLVIDGVIDIPRTREWLPDKPDEFFLQPDDIAETVWAVTRQARSAWTFELDVRPFGEDW